MSNPIAPRSRSHRPRLLLAKVGLCAVLVTTYGAAVAPLGAEAAPVQAAPDPAVTTPPTTAPPPTTTAPPATTAPTNPPPTTAPTAPNQPAPPPPATSIPPDLPVIQPPPDPNQPAPPPPPPIPDPSPQVAAFVAQMQMQALMTSLAAAQATYDKVAAVQASVQAIHDGAAQALDAKRKALTDAATYAYVQGGVDEVGENAQSASPEGSVSVESARMLAGSAIDHTHTELVAAEMRMRIANRVLDDVNRIADKAHAALDTAQQQVDTANAAIANAGLGGLLTVDLSPTVLGASVLTPAEIVGWYQSKGVVGYDAGVDLTTLATYYVTEGEAEGVRGDVAFAQSMVETGAFTSPLTTHSNFAGIGACDSCATGFDFPSPQLGVRAQMQLLHAYADKSLSVLGLANPPVGADPDHLSVRGCCPTWNKLTGTWATDPNYGPKIMTIYLSMLQYAYNSRTAPPPAPVEPSIAPAPGSP
jgi:hypothetical protein